MRTQKEIRRPHQCAVRKSRGMSLTKRDEKYKEMVIDFASLARHPPLPPIRSILYLRETGAVAKRHGKLRGG
jgi:hypothetical protein